MGGHGGGSSRPWQSAGYVNECLRRGPSHTWAQEHSPPSPDTSARVYGSNWESCRDRRLHGQVTMQVNGAMLLGRAVPRSWEASGLRHKMLGVEQGVLQSHDTRRGTSV